MQVVSLYRFWIFALLALALSACGNEIVEAEKNYIVKPDGTIVYKSEGIELTLLEKGESGNVKNFDGVSMVFKEVKALDYLKRTGDKVSEADKKDLLRESVFMLEFVGHKTSGSLFENDEILLSEDDATKYLIGDIANDFVVVQKGKKFNAQGVQYDGKIGAGQKIRVTFFLVGVDLNSPYNIEYTDRLFGKGKIKMTKTKNDLTS
jgi:hypothetical protein